MVLFDNVPLAPAGSEGEGGVTVRELLAFGEKYRPTAPLWRAYLAYRLMISENPYSLSVEGAAHRPSASGRAPTAAAEATLYRYALSDIAAIRAAAEHPTDPLFTAPFVPLSDDPEDADQRTDRRIGRTVSRLADRLAEAASDADFLAILTDFYRENGVGSFGLCPAFYLDPDGAICPVSHFCQVGFDDLYGYGSQKEKIIANLTAYVSGEPANNMLLYGDAGTGKSTCIKAVVNRFSADGLRMIQIRKDQYVHLERVIAALRGRGYRFVLYLDDLSFEEFEIEYKYLKAAIEGGLESTPENLLIFATSNRRHLIRETFDEREGGGDVHRNESIQEKISLSDRFGLQIRFGAPAQEEYFAIVRFLAAGRGLAIDDRELIEGARQFAVAHSGFSGRIAEQYVRGLHRDCDSEQ